MLKRLSCSLSFSVFTPYPTQLPIIPLWCLVPSMVIMRYHHKSCLWSLAACVYVYFCFVCYVLICILNVPKQFSKWLLSVNFSDAVSVKLRLNLSNAFLYLISDVGILQMVCPMSGNKRGHWIVPSCLLCFLCVFFCLALEGMQNILPHSHIYMTVLNIPYLHTFIPFSTPCFSFMFYVC